MPGKEKVTIPQKEKKEKKEQTETDELSTIILSRNIEKLKETLEKGTEHTNYHLNLAAEIGQYDAFIMLAQSFQPSEFCETETFNCAVRGANRKIIQHCIDNNFPCNDETTGWAIEQNDYDTLKFLLESGMPYGEKTFAFVGYLDETSRREDFITILESYQCKKGPGVCRGAAYRGDFPFLKRLHEAGFPWDKEHRFNNISVNAASGGSVECLKYVLENGCKLNRDCLWHACDSGNSECFRYICEELRPSFLKEEKQYPTYTESSVERNDLKMLKLVIEEGFTLTKSALFGAKKMRETKFKGKKKAQKINAEIIEFLEEVEKDGWIAQGAVPPMAYDFSRIQVFKF